MSDAGPDALAALLAACARGDRNAFRRLYAATSPKLFGVAVRILRRDHWAEEVLQDCYVRVWERAGDYSPALAQPMTWMTSIVRNRCLDWLRRPALEVADPEGTAAEETLSGDAGPLDALEGEREAAAMRRCLATLDARQRQCLALAYYDGLSHSEVAAHLQTPLGSVKTWVRRGLLQLRACLERA